MPRPVVWGRAAAVAARSALRLDARSVTREEFARWDGKEPVILTNATKVLGNSDGGAGDAEKQSAAAEAFWADWRRNLAENHKERPLRYTRRSPDGGREVSWTRLGDFLSVIEAQGERTPEPNLFAFEQDPAFSEEVLRPSSLPPLLDGTDFFQEFLPKNWCPNKFSLLLGTSGARSALHTDPFGWTGWNLLLSGRKRWRFVRPGEQAEHALYIERPERVNLAAHGESPVDLFATSKIPSAGGADVAGGGPDLERYPRAAEAEVAFEVEQEAGEAIVFPASWWHQTLHLSPTLALASQYVNENNARDVLDGIALRAALAESSLDPSWRKLPWPEQISALLQALAADGWARREG